MTDPNERSDPVQRHTEVTTEQLDALHTTCNGYRCIGPVRARERRLAARAVEDGKILAADVSERLGAVSAALSDVAETARVWTAANRNWLARAAAQTDRHAEYYRTRTEQPLEPLADWERELLAGVEAERNAPRGTIARALQAGLITEEEARNHRPLTRSELHDPQFDALQAGLQHQRIGNTPSF